MSVWEGAEDLSTSSRNKVYFTDYFPHISLIWGEKKGGKKKKNPFFSRPNQTADTLAVLLCRSGRYQMRWQ